MTIRSYDDVHPLCKCKCSSITGNPPVSSVPTGYCIDYPHLAIGRRGRFKDGGYICHDAFEVSLCSNIIVCQSGQPLDNTELPRFSNCNLPHCGGYITVDNFYGNGGPLSGANIATLSGLEICDFGSFRPNRGTHVNEYCTQTQGFSFSGVDCDEENCYKIRGWISCDQTDGSVPCTSPVDTTVICFDRISPAHHGEVLTGLYSDPTVGSGYPLSPELG
jgi:hypothetical protein